METSSAATFISNKLKYHVFLLIFSLFSSIKLENKMAEQVLPREGGLAPVGGGGDGKKE
jgi:hypothetical protein